MKEAASHDPGESPPDTIDTPPGVRKGDSEQQGQRMGMKSLPLIQSKMPPIIKCIIISYSAKKEKHWKSHSDVPSVVRLN